MPKSLIASQILCLSLALTACGSKEDPGTSVRVALSYDSAVGLDTVDVTAGADTVNAPISPELLLLLPDDAADTDMPIEVWARANGKRAAYGTTTVTPVRGTTVKATLSLTTCSPGCGANDELTTCTGPAVTCGLGCSSDGDAHCVVPKLSNGIDPTLAEHVRDIDLAEDTLFDVDTGEIIGGVERAKGEGTIAGITYAQLPAPANGVPLAVFAFRNLTVQALATVQFTGSRAVVFLVGDTATIDGTIDLAAHDADPGPGGGIGGASPTMLASGCGPGGPGGTTSKTNGAADGGGGGGGGGTAGGAGGNAYNGAADDTASGGAAGGMCLSSQLVPLRGGSGGGAGNYISGLRYAKGGGGGGALQLSALNHLVVTGTIHAGGAGGAGGNEAMTSPGPGAGAAGGGGSGGAILIESPYIELGASAMLAVNGGGGGGGGQDKTKGEPGENGKPSASPAAGGAGALALITGGAGGALDAPPKSGGGSNGTAAAPNGGGGGGAAGVIVVRGRVRSIAGVSSPRATELDIQVK